LVNLREGENMDNQLKYPVGCRISWCHEEFEVIENHNDLNGTVKQGNDIITNFYFFISR
jgi:hypothetical protein